MIIVRENKVDFEVQLAQSNILGCGVSKTCSNVLQQPKDILATNILARAYLRDKLIIYNIFIYT